MAQGNQGGRGGAVQGNGGGRRMTAVEERREQEKQLLKQFGAMVVALEPNLVEVMPKGGDAAKLKRIALTAAQKNPDLLTCSRESWITALTLCAQDGLMPDGREAAFVKFGGTGGPTVQYMPMVYGLRKKMLQSGEIRDIFTAVVYEQEFNEGLFEVELGSDPKIFHKPLLGAGDRGPIIAAYSVATYKDGSRSFEVMTTAEIEKVRMVSQTGKKNEGPWRDWYGEMARKTVLRRHSKSLPMSSDLRDVEVEHMFDREEYEKRIAPSSTDTGLGGGPARSSQLLRDDTRGRLDDIEERAFGAEVQIEPEGGATVDNGELVDSGTGEVQRRGNAAEEGGASELGQDEDDAANLRTGEADGIVKTAIEAEAGGGTAELGGGEATEESDVDDEVDPEILAAANKEADRIIKLYELAPNVIDLRGARETNQFAIDAMPEEPAGRVARAYNAALKRLGAK